MTTNMVDMKKEIKQNINYLIEKGSLSKALDLIRQYDNILPNDVEICSMKAVIAIMEGELSKAEGILNEGLSIDDKNFDLLYNLAYVYQSREQFDFAAECYKKALHNAKEDNDANRAKEMLQGLGYVESKTPLKMDSKKGTCFCDTETSQYRENEGKAKELDEMGKYKKQFKESIQSLVEQGLLQEAKAMISEYEKMVKDDIDVYSILGVIAMMEGDLAEAEKVLKRGIDAQPFNSNLHYNLAFLYETQGKYVTSYRYYKKIIKTANQAIVDEAKIKAAQLEACEDVQRYNQRKKVLIIAYAFPPIGGPGVQRTLKFVKYLREFGWEPIVLTVGETEWTTRDETLLREVPDEINIVRINDVKPKEIDNDFANNLIRMYSKIIKDKELFERYMKLLNSGNENLTKYLFIPEYQSAWALKVIDSIENYIDMSEIDVIYTSADPNADNFIGYFLKEKFNRPWIADFRDAWTKNPYTNYDKSDIKYEIECAMEKTLVPYADYLVTTTEVITQDFVSDLNLNSKNTQTITNGYDEQDFVGISDNKVMNSKFTIMYNGLFYQTRTPLTFLKAIRNIIDKQLIDRKKLKIWFTRKDDWMKVVNQMGLDDIVEFVGYMEHQDSLKKSITSDLLLLIVGSGEENKGIYTGKVFEYLRLRKPILSLSPSGSLVEKLIDETKRGKNIELNDINKIENYILEMYKRWETKQLPMLSVTEEVTRYERKQLTEELSNVLLKVTDKHRTQNQMEKQLSKNNLIEKNSDFYDKLFESGGWNETYFKHYSETHYYKIWLKALELINRTTSPKIIEIGCGPGQFAKLLFDNNIDNYKGIDFSQEAIKYAKIRNDKYRNVFNVDNAYTTEIFEEDYNIVVIFEVLEHVDRDLEILSRIKENSNVLFSVPNFYSDGHVRWFNSKEEIVERYEKYVVIEDVFSFSTGGNNKIFLIKGKSKKQKKSNKNHIICKSLATE